MSRMDGLKLNVGINSDPDGNIPQLVLWDICHAVGGG
jgi:hypothetical protein